MCVTQTQSTPWARPAHALAPGWQPGPEARALLREEWTNREYLDALIGGRHYPDAVRFLACVLPKCEALGWACKCVRAAVGDDMPAGYAAALEAAEGWAADPTEGKRRAAQPAAEAVGFGTAAGCAALAAFFSGGSLGPANVPVIPPGEHLTAQAVAGAVMLAAVMQPEMAAERYRAFLVEGTALADGIHPS